MSIPTQWSPDFVIEITYNNSMGGTNEAIRFTFEKCVVSRTSRTGGTNYEFMLDDDKRNKVLQQLRSESIQGVTSQHKMVAVRDGWSRMICVGENCVGEGPGYEMSTNDREKFMSVYSFLDEFAAKHGKK